MYLLMRRASLVFAQIALGTDELPMVRRTHRAEALAAALREWEEQSAESLVVGEKDYVLLQHEAEFDEALKALIEEYQIAKGLGDGAVVGLSDFFEGISLPHWEEHLGNKLRHLKHIAAQAHYRSLYVDRGSVILYDGSVWIPPPHLRRGEEWTVRNSDNDCRFTFVTQPDDAQETAFVTTLESMRHFSYDFLAVCLGDEEGLVRLGLGAEPPAEHFQVDVDATEVSVIKGTFNEPRLLIECFYENPRAFFSASWGPKPKIGEYSVPLNPASPARTEFIAHALELISPVPPHFKSGADQVVREATYRGGPQFAYRKSRAGQLCLDFQAAKGAYMGHVLAVPPENTMPDGGTRVLDPVIASFLKSIPRT
jgi:hypothetical protein